MKIQIFGSFSFAIIGTEAITILIELHKFDIKFGSLCASQVKFDFKKFFYNFKNNQKSFKI